MRKGVAEHKQSTIFEKQLAIFVLKEK